MPHIVHSRLALLHTIPSQDNFISSLISKRKTKSLMQISLPNLSSLSSLDLPPSFDPALHFLTTTLFLLAEYAFLSNIWILSPGPATAPKQYNVSATFTTIAYALSEPIWTLALKNLPLPEWFPFPAARILEISSAVHGVTMVFAANVVSGWIETDLKAGRLRAVDETSDTSSKSEANTPPPPPLRPGFAVYVAYLLPIQTAALAHSALYIFYSQLQQTPSPERRAGNSRLSDLFILYQFVVWHGIGSWFLGRVLCRAGFWRWRKREDLRGQMGRLILLLVVRGLGRWAVGAEVLPGMVRVR